VGPLQDARFDPETHESAIQGVLEEMAKARAALFPAVVRLAMAKAWRAWDASQAQGTVATFDTEMLLDAADPDVRRAADALAAIEGAFLDLGGIPPGSDDE